VVTPVLYPEPALRLKGINAENVSICGELLVQRTWAFVSVAGFVKEKLTADSDGFQTDSPVFITWQGICGDLSESVESAVSLLCNHRPRKPPGCGKPVEFTGATTKTPENPGVSPISDADFSKSASR
jgi:hypothetical protein